MDDFDDLLLKKLSIPVVALMGGGLLMLTAKTTPAGKIAFFFGGNSMMNLYMKAVLSEASVSRDEGLRGVPAPFAVTAIQQVVSFLLFAFWVLLSLLLPQGLCGGGGGGGGCRYAPRVLRCWGEWGRVALFALAFTGNVALNNYGVQLLPLSVNLVIRSCIPAATILVQALLARCQGLQADDTRPAEVVLIAIGVLGAIAVVASQMHDEGAPVGERRDMVLGIFVTVGALCFKALNLVLAAMLGSSCKLNALDTTLYMSLPVALVLVAPCLLYRHSLETWPGYGGATDWDVIAKVAESSPRTLSLVFASGALALFYNALSWNIVHDLSAGTLAFAENFNSSATIAIAVLAGFERLPAGAWGVVFVVAVAACIGSFAAYSYIKMASRAKEARESRRPAGATPRDDPLHAKLSEAGKHQAFPDSP